MEVQDSLNPDGEPEALEPDGEDETEKERKRAENQKIRAEKAEKDNKALRAELAKKAETETPKTDALSLKDQYALLEAKVHPDDLDEVIDFARFKKIGVAEALKQKVIKGLLSEREEERKSAVASNTGGAKKGAIRLSDEALIERAFSEGLPEKDDDIERLAQARLNQKIKKA